MNPDKRFIEALARALETPDGVYMFKRIMQMCGYQVPSTAVGPSGEISPIHTVYNAARANLYLELRSFIPPEYLARIEIDVESQPTGEQSWQEKAKPPEPEWTQEPSHKAQSRQRVRSKLMNMEQ